jgi:hypothetical protein
VSADTFEPKIEAAISPQITKRIPATLLISHETPGKQMPHLQGRVAEKL